MHDTSAASHTSIFVGFGLHNHWVGGLLVGLCVCIYVFIYVCIYVCMYVCMLYVYMYACMTVGMHERV